VRATPAHAVSRAGWRAAIMVLRVGRQSGTGTKARLEEG